MYKTTCRVNGFLHISVDALMEASSQVLGEKKIRKLTLEDPELSSITNDQVEWVCIVK